MIALPLIPAKWEDNPAFVECGLQCGAFWRRLPPIRTGQNCFASIQNSKRKTSNKFWNLPQPAYPMRQLIFEWHERPAPRPRTAPLHRQPVSPIRTYCLSHRRNWAGKGSRLGDSRLRAKARFDRRNPRRGFSYATSDRRCGFAVGNPSSAATAESPSCGRRYFGGAHS